MIPWLIHTILLTFVSFNLGSFSLRRDTELPDGLHHSRIRRDFSVLYSYDTHRQGSKEQKGMTGIKDSPEL